MSIWRRLFYIVFAIVVIVAAVQITSLLIEGKPKQVTEPSQAGQCSAKVNIASLRCEVNKARQANGLTPLRINKDLRESARTHAKAMVNAHFFSHISTNGDTVEDRIRRAGYLRGYRSWNVGENIAYGIGSKGTPRSIVQQWLDSPPHRAIMLSPNFRDAGGGIAKGNPSSGRFGFTYVLNVGKRNR